MTSFLNRVTERALGTNGIDYAHSGATLRKKRRVQKLNIILNALLAATLITAFATAIKPTASPPAALTTTKINPLPEGFTVITIPIASEPTMLHINDAIELSAGDAQFEAIVVKLANENGTYASASVNVISVGVALESAHELLAKSEQNPLLATMKND